MGDLDELPAKRRCRMVEAAKRGVVSVASPEQADGLLRELEAAGFVEMVTGGGMAVLTKRGVECLVSVLLRGKRDWWEAGCGKVERPEYDAKARVLRWYSEVVKELKREAPNQEALLLACPDYDAGAPIPNPLQVDSYDSPSEVLVQTVKDVNKGVKPGTIRFHMDGKGTGFCWKPLS